MLRYATRIRTVGLRGFRGDDYLALVVWLPPRLIAVLCLLTTTVSLSVYDLHHHRLCYLLYGRQSQCRSRQGRSIDTQ